MKARSRDREKRLPRLLASRQAEGVSGIVRASRGRLRRLFCMDHGWLAFAASNLLEEQFPETLVQSGLLTAASRVQVLEEAGRTRAKFGAVLRAKRLVREDALRDAMERHVATLLSSCLEWPDPVVAFEGGHPALDGEITVRLSPVPLILQHARRFPAALDAVRVRIGPPDLRPVRSAVLASLAATVEADPAVRFVLERADGTATVGEIARAAPEGEAPALRAIYGLLLAGLLDPTKADATAAADRKRSEPELSREEVEARLALPSAADHYAVLGLERSASRNQIRDAYYALARRYHPDRFRAGPLAGLRERVEEYFTRVTEAYNTLFSPERRSEYDALASAPAQADGARAGDTAHLARQNYVRGRQLIERKRLAEALVFLENAVNLEDKVPEYHLELGLLLARSPKRREDAEFHLLTATTLNPSLAIGYLGLGQLYRKAGRDEEAARMFREVLRWDPSHAEASAELAALRK